MPPPKAIQPAPGPLDHIRRFVNTFDIEEGQDELRVPEALRRWLVEGNLLIEQVPLTLHDLERARLVREALRAMLLANNGVGADAPAVSYLNEVVDLTGLRPRFRPDGTAGLEPLRPGLDGALGQLLAIAYASMGDGSWWRLKACPEPRCRWAFYDSSKNRSRRWCTMSECGNRAKGRRYRARRQEAEATAIAGASAAP